MNSKGSSYEKGIFSYSDGRLMNQSARAATTCSVIGVDPSQPDGSSYTEGLVVNQAVDETPLVPTRLVTLPSSNLSVIYMSDQFGQHFIIITDGKTNLAGGSSNGSKLEFHDAGLKLLVLCEKKSSL